MNFRDQKHKKRKLEEYIYETSLLKKYMFNQFSLGFSKTSPA